VYLQDIVPSTPELAGVDKPEHVQFKSLMPLIEARKDESHDAVCGGYKNLQRRVTADGFKLIIYPKIDETILYDLLDDPLAMHDPADRPEYAEKVVELKEIPCKLREETGDRLKIE